MIVLVDTMQQDDSHLEISRLLARLINGTITAQEAAWLEAWRQESPANNELFTRMTDPTYLTTQLEDWEVEGQAQAKELFLEKKRMAKIRHFRLYAAAIVLLLALAGGGTYLVLQQQLPVKVLQVEDMRADSSFMPRGNVAKLVMKNGQEMELKGDAQQEFEEDDGTRVKNGYSALRYNSRRQAAADAAPVFHTLVTPRGGEYTVVLADGTTARLNAASSLRFPTRFEGKERVVELSGEAYFEVAGDAQHPFVVKTPRSLVRVLGTEFNVYAYTDMPDERTTLANGAVKVSHGQHDAGVVLQPGFQARIQSAGSAVKVERADMEEAMAWKNGLFVFNAASLGDILRQVGRWYDVDINCESSMARKFHFSGRIHRYENIAGVLELLEMTGKVKFVLEGRTLMVIPAKSERS